MLNDFAPGLLITVLGVSTFILSDNSSGVRDAL